MTWDVICHVLQPFGMVQAVKGNSICQLIQNGQQLNGAFGFMGTVALL